MRPCPKCVVDVEPSIALDDDFSRLEKCPRCENVLDRTPHVGAPSVARFAENKTAAPKATMLALSPTANQASITDQIRARLAAVEADLERTASLRKERGQLRAMLKAAERQR